MISGEHAVLHGALALVGAVNARVTVSLAPRHDRRVIIHSALGTRDTTLDAPDASPPFRFIGFILQRLGKRCPSGFDLNITADMPPDVGLGSSAAVTIATLAALHAWSGGDAPPPTRNELLREALSIVRAIQGSASGADLAASIRGGILLYRQTPAVLRRYTIFPAISLVYAGYKTPTAVVIREVEARRNVATDGFQDLYARINACTEAADAALEAADGKRLADALHQGQSLMQELGVCDGTLADIVHRLRSVPGITAAKISGSGLGDCVLALGELPAGALPYRQIPVQFSEQGLTLSTAIS